MCNLDYVQFCILAMYYIERYENKLKLKLKLKTSYRQFEIVAINDVGYKGINMICDNIDHNFKIYSCRWWNYFIKTNAV